MPWLWNSWEEYLAAVHPVAVDSGGGLWHAKKDTWFENVCRLCKAVRKLEDCRNSLRELGFTGKDHSLPPDDPEISQDASNLVLEAVYAGEELLFFDRRLCEAADPAYGFRHQKSILEHWERYSTSSRIAAEIHQLVKDIDEMLSGYYSLIQADRRFIVENLDLPDSLESDFRLARDLFSAGFDEVGLLIAGRGLEGVLRRIAGVRKILLQQTKKLIPASEADAYDLIEIMYHVKWKTTGVRLISQETRALLHYLRTLRNGGAHPKDDAKPNSTVREVALVVSETANRLWNQISKTRAQIDPKTVQKNW